MDPKFKKLSDVALSAPTAALQLPLAEVGLEDVATQVRVAGALTPARAQAKVSLINSGARGIHMSRLFRILSDLHSQDLSWAWLGSCAEQMLASQKSLSDSAELSVGFDWLTERKALLSETLGWRSYPLVYTAAIKSAEVRFSLSMRILYSSTCPCSASLSQEAVSERFVAEFANQTLDTDRVAEWLAQTAAVAVPHAQRSEAVCEFGIDPAIGNPSPLTMIDTIENALGTPVQAAVKREDEQEFARRNAQNLMFCEDAARRLQSALMKRSDIVDFSIEVRHFESLHAHNVVARAGTRK